MKARPFVSTAVKSRYNTFTACLTKAHASIGPSWSFLHSLKTMACVMFGAVRFGAGASMTSRVNVSTSLQNSLEFLHCVRCSMLSTHPQLSLHLSVGAFALRVAVRTLMARCTCSSLRHCFSSVASESGVPSVGQILSKGTAPPILSGQLISQFAGQRTVDLAVCRAYMSHVFGPPGP